MANMLDMGIDPFNIMAITFTNKAAREMRERVKAMMSDAADRIWVATFHSTCLKMMFKFAGYLGYTESFEIADTTDQKSIMKEIYKELDIDRKMYPEKRLLNAISKAKDELIDPEEYEKLNKNDFSKEVSIKVYKEYQKKLRKNNSMDFDDLIFNTVRLFRENKEALEYYQERFRYIMVDEYQDTNTAQFEFVRLLADKYKNLCVVGDDDQSIYRFRGANIYNILNFEKSFHGALVIKLEENYRSTSNILDAANALIGHNTQRKAKSLWTENEIGSLIHFKQLDNAKGEASYIADDIRSRAERDHLEYGDFAVLIRTNVQSKELEDAFRIRGMEYDLVKGLRFWDTKVIKDLTAYLMTVSDGMNDLRTLRIINVPGRKIGASTVEKCLTFAAANGFSIFETAGMADKVPSLSSKGAQSMRAFYDLIMDIRQDCEGMSFVRLLDTILERTDYLSYLEEKSETVEKYQEAVEYINKLKETLDIYEEETEEPTLIDFMRVNGLEGNNLDKNGEGDRRERIQIMTMHNAKGLEFPNVYMAGVEEGLFPGFATLTSDDQFAMEEERRLCYVAMTRAKKELTITCARQRMVNGETRYSNASRFVREIPIGLMDMKVTPVRRSPDDEPKADTKQIAHSAFTAAPTAFSKGFKKRSLTEGPKLPDYREGDRVLSFKFGEGVVCRIVNGGRDYEVTVDFDESGTKKMFAGFAKLKKI